MWEFARRKFLPELGSPGGLKLRRSPLFAFADAPVSFDFPKVTPCFDQVTMVAKNSAIFDGIVAAPDAGNDVVKVVLPPFNNFSAFWILTMDSALAISRPTFGLALCGFREFMALHSAASVVRTKSLYS